MWITFLQELLFPSFCLGCRREGSLLCGDCRATLDISPYNYCLCNRQPLRLPREAAAGTCGRCRGRKLSGIYAALPYRERSLTRETITRFKYPPYLRQLARPLAALVAEHLTLAGNTAESIWENSVLVPVPMERGKQKRRGYNQSEELAKQLSPITKTPFAGGNLVKTRATKPQMKLSAAERQENLTGAFAIKNPAEFAGKKVFLVDDVYTTGATMEECARALRAAGAKTIWGIAIAREG